MKKFSKITDFLSNAFDREDLKELLIYIKESDYGCINRPLNIYGERNCGKTALARLLKEMFKDAAVIMDRWQFLSKFNNHWADKKLVIIDERIITDDRFIEKVINTYHSEYIHVETKGQMPWEVFNNITFIIFTELPLTENDEIVTMRMRLPIFYDRMVAELPSFTAYIKNPQP